MLWSIAPASARQGPPGRTARGQKRVMGQARKPRSSVVAYPATLGSEVQQLALHLNQARARGRPSCQVGIPQDLRRQAPPEDPIEPDSGDLVAAAGMGRDVHLLQRAEDRPESAPWWQASADQRDVPRGPPGRIAAPRKFAVALGDNVVASLCLWLATSAPRPAAPGTSGPGSWSLRTAAASADRAAGLHQDGQALEAPGARARNGATREVGGLPLAHGPGAGPRARSGGSPLAHGPEAGPRARPGGSPLARGPEAGPRARSGGSPLAHGPEAGPRARWEGSPPGARAPSWATCEAETERLILSH